MPHENFDRIGVKFGKILIAEFEYYSNCVLIKDPSRSHVEFCLCHAGRGNGGAEGRVVVYRRVRTSLSLSIDSRAPSFVVDSTRRSRSLTIPSRSEASNSQFRAVELRSPEQKKKRVMYDYKLNLWDWQDGERKPISLSNWRIMNVLICEAATRKLVEHGPLNGGVGQKHWQEHSDGTRKTSELPDSERFGHTVIRFSTKEAQDWYEPLVDSVLGTAQDSSEIKLTTEVEANDGRARYVVSLPAADFKAFGNTKRGREITLRTLILAALGESTDDGEEDQDLCHIYSSFLFQEKVREDMWKIGIKFPTVLETKMDATLRGEKFGILPTAITSVRVLKKQNSSTEEEKISQALKKTELEPSRSPSRSLSRDSKRGRNESGEDPMNPKKVADQVTPEAMKYNF